MASPLAVQSQVWAPLAPALPFGLSAHPPVPPDLQRPHEHQPGPFPPHVAIRARVEGTRIEIESGVKPRERVVIDGMDRLRDGMKVEVAERRVLEGDGKGKGKGKGGRKGGDASKADVKGDPAKGDAPKADAAKADGASTDAAQADRPRRKKPLADGAAVDAPQDGVPAAGAAKSEAAGAEAPKEARKKGDGSWRKKKDAEAAAQ